MSLLTELQKYAPPEERGAYKSGERYKMFQVSYPSPRKRRQRATFCYIPERDGDVDGNISMLAKMAECTRSEVVIGAIRAVAEDTGLIRPDFKAELRAVAAHSGINNLSRTVVAAVKLAWMQHLTQAETDGYQ